MLQLVILASERTAMHVEASGTNWSLLLLKATSFLDEAVLFCNIIMFLNIICNMKFFLFRKIGLKRLLAKNEIIIQTVSGYWNKSCSYLWSAIFEGPCFNM